MAATCRTCGESYSEFGDGWDGECPTCADRSYAADEKADAIEAGVCLAGNPAVNGVCGDPDCVCAP